MSQALELLTQGTSLASSGLVASLVTAAASSLLLPSASPSFDANAIVSTDPLLRQQNTASTFVSSTLATVFTPAVIASLLGTTAATAVAASLSDNEEELVPSGTVSFTPTYSVSEEENEEQEEPTITVTCTPHDKSAACERPVGSKWGYIVVVILLASLLVLSGVTLFMLYLRNRRMEQLEAEMELELAAELGEDRELTARNQRNSPPTPPPPDATTTAVVEGGGEETMRTEQTEVERSNEEVVQKTGGLGRRLSLLWSKLRSHGADSGALGTSQRRFPAPHRYFLDGRRVHGNNNEYSDNDDDMYLTDGEYACSDDETVYDAEISLRNLREVELARLLDMEAGRAAERELLEKGRRLRSGWRGAGQRQKAPERMPLQSGCGGSSRRSGETLTPPYGSAGVVGISQYDEKCGGYRTKQEAGWIGGDEEEREEEDPFCDQSGYDSSGLRRQKEVDGDGSKEGGFTRAVSLNKPNTRYLVRPSMMGGRMNGKSLLEAVGSVGEEEGGHYQGLRGSYGIRFEGAIADAKEDDDSICENVALANVPSVESAAGLDARVVEAAVPIGDLPDVVETYFGGMRGSRQQQSKMKGRRVGGGRKLAGAYEEQSRSTFQPAEERWCSHSAGGVGDGCGMPHGEDRNEKRLSAEDEEEIDYVCRVLLPTPTSGGSSSRGLFLANGSENVSGGDSSSSSKGTFLSLRENGPSCGRFDYKDKRNRGGNTRSRGDISERMGVRGAGGAESKVGWGRFSSGSRILVGSGDNMGTGGSSSNTSGGNSNNRGYDILGDGIVGMERGIIEVVQLGLPAG